MRGIKFILIMTFIVSSVNAGFCAAKKNVINETRFDACFVSAGQRYLIDPNLLKAIARQESGLDPGATNINRSKNGKTSTDYGIMQINSVQIPELIKKGIIHRARDLLEKPCLNIQIGAWVLARHFKQCGVNWSCLGSYNAGFVKDNEKKRMHYAGLIYNRYIPGAPTGK